MKHRRGIDLDRPGREDVTYLGPLPDPQHTTFDDIPQWHAVGAHCTKCERTGWLLRGEQADRWGGGAFLGSLQQRLRCLACGNKTGNVWVVGQLAR